MSATSKRRYHATESKYKGGAREMYVTYDLEQETRGGDTALYPKVKRVYIAGDVTGWQVGDFEKRSGKRVHGVRVEYEQSREGYTRKGYAAKRGDTYDQSRWTRWEETGADKVAAVPGAVDTLAAARREGITVIFNSNRSTETAAQTIAALDGAGLGPAVLGDTLWLRDAGSPSGKDERRWKIAEKYCVVAMVGDQLGDFSDLFNTPDNTVNSRRNMTAESLLTPLWGAGWFVLPNPVYGSALKGSFDEVFPKDKQWADPAEEKK